jgi:hypothetical protein
MQMSYYNPFNLRYKRQANIFKRAFFVFFGTSKVNHEFNLGIFNYLTLGIPQFNLGIFDYLTLGIPLVIMLLMLWAIDKVPNLLSLLFIVPISLMALRFVFAAVATLAISPLIGLYKAFDFIFSLFRNVKKQHPLPNPISPRDDIEYQANRYGLVNGLDDKTILQERLEIRHNKNSNDPTIPLLRREINKIDALIAARAIREQKVSARSNAAAMFQAPLVELKPVNSASSAGVEPARRVV